MTRLTGPAEFSLEFAVGGQPWPDENFSVQLETLASWAVKYCTDFWIMIIVLVRVSESSSSSASIMNWFNILSKNNWRMKRWPGESFVITKYKNWKKVTSSSATILEQYIGWDKKISFVLAWAFKIITLRKKHFKTMNTWFKTTEIANLGVCCKNEKKYGNSKE